jgi:hypothetical protein
VPYASEGEGLHLPPVPEALNWVFVSLYPKGNNAKNRINITQQRSATTLRISQKIRMIRCCFSRARFQPRAEPSILNDKLSRHAGWTECRVRFDRMSIQKLRAQSISGCISKGSQGLVTSGKNRRGGPFVQASMESKWELTCAVGFA